MKSLVAEPAESTLVPELIAATEQAMPQQVNALARARAFAEPLISAETLDTGENTLHHADAVAAILKTMGGSEAMQAASYLVYACTYLNKPQEVIAKAFGESYAALAIETTKLVRVQRQARGAHAEETREDIIESLQCVEPKMALALQLAQIERSRALVHSKIFVPV